MGQRRFGLFGVNASFMGMEFSREGRKCQFTVTGMLSHGARVAIRPRKMTKRLRNGLYFRVPAQNTVTSWCQSLPGCDKNLCLHYETTEIHDFGSKSCSSWICSSHMAR